MAKKSQRKPFHLKCSVCNEQNYTTTKNSLNSDAKIEIKKYCSRCRKSTLHKEAKIK